jgi:hypothetical protein
MRTQTAVVVALGVLCGFGCNKAERGYPTISARSPDGGNVNVHGDYNRCPQVIFIATPDHVPVGRPISLTAMASDLDGHQLSYAWKATSGSFSAPSAPTTTFECARNGDVTITLTVTDGSCPAEISGVVLCQPGDGGAADGGSPDGRGGGGQPGTGGQPGIGGQSGTGTTGAAGIGVGGRGGSGSGGTAGAGTGGAGTGGVAGSTGVAGGRGGSSAGGSGGDGGPCVETNPPPDVAESCTTCLMEMSSPASDGCCLIADAVARDLCQAASACFRAGNCNDSGDTAPCYCGTSGTMGCPSGAANGPCVQQVTAAASRNIDTGATDSPSPALILQRFGVPQYPLGRAAGIHTIAGAFCPAECGF